MTRSLSLVGLLLVTTIACLPDLDETGKLCSATRPCGPGYVCTAAGVCADAATDAGVVPADAGRDAGADAGPRVDAGLDAGVDAGLDAGIDAGLDAGDGCDITLLNPSFEQGMGTNGLRNWRANTGTVTQAVPGRTGMYSARLWTGNANNPSMQADQLACQTTPGTWFCARAYATHASDASVTVSLVIRERLPDGGVLDGSNGNPTTVVKGAWQPVEETYRAFGGASAVDLRVVTTRVDIDASVLIDDALLFRSTTPSCVFPP